MVTVRKLGDSRTTWTTWGAPTTTVVMDGWGFATSVTTAGWAACGGATTVMTLGAGSGGGTKTVETDGAATTGAGANTVDTATWRGARVLEKIELVERSSSAKAPAGALRTATALEKLPASKRLVILE